MNIAETISFDKDGQPEKSSSWRHLLRKVFLALTILLTATLAFAVGRLTATPSGEGVSIEYDKTLTDNLLPTTNSQAAAATKALPPSSPLAPSTPSVPSGGVVASKSGSKYHYPSCPGAKQIKEANKISFATPAEAEAAGYTLAANCKTP